MIDKQKHFHINWKTIQVALALLVLCLSIHYLVLLIDIGWLKAIVLRIYYIPVLFAALRGGLLAGSSIGLLAAISHVLMMIFFSSSQNSIHSSVLFTEHFIEMPLLFLSGFLTGAIHDYMQHEKKEKENVSSLLGKHVSPDVALKLINNEIHIDGEIKKATVLFIDLRDFTAISENKKPAELLKLLNKYFSAMTNILIKNGAFIDKYIGDAIMAVFGVPVEDNQSAKMAVSSAIEMIKTLEELNQKNEFGKLKLNVSIGIHTGELIAGMIGSDVRQDYTVIGDTVNLASRLEALNRKYNTKILISASSNKEILSENDFLKREVDKVKVKGRAEPVVIYEILN